MYIMTERGWMPLWTLSEVSITKVDLGPISGAFKDVDSNGEWIGERTAITTARNQFHADEKAKVIGLREAWEAKRQPKAVEYAVKWGRLYRGLFEGAYEWFIDPSKAEWYIAKEVFDDYDVSDDEFITVREQA